MNADVFELHALSSTTFKIIMKYRVHIYPSISFSGLENVRPNDCHISLKESWEYISCVSVESCDDGSG